MLLRNKGVMSCYDSWTEVSLYIGAFSSCTHTLLAIGTDPQINLCTVNNMSRPVKCLSPIARCLFISLCCSLKIDKQHCTAICVELVCCWWHNRDNQEDCAWFSPKVMRRLLTPVEESAFSENTTEESILPLHSQNITAINKTYPAHSVLWLVTSHGVLS